MPERKITDKKIGSKVNYTPVVSVIIPAYNAAEFIAETLASVFSQTYKNYETIVVNDGSPDTAEFEKKLEKYSHKLVYIKQENGGTAAARNTAIENARGKFLAFLDGDDVWFSDYLESQIPALEAKNCDLIYCDAKLFGAVRNQKETYMEKSPSRGAVTTESLIDGSCNVITSGTIARREEIIHAGMFDESLPRIGMEDFDLWFRLAKSGVKLDYQKKVLLKYRVRPNSLSGSNVQRAERNIVALDVINEKYDLSDAEQAAFAKQRACAVAELEMEKGKYSLAKNDFKQAHEHFSAANRLNRKLKITVLTQLLKFNPRFVRKIFQTLRPAEFSFVLPEQEAEKR